LEEKLRQKNEMAGGVSDVEFNNLRESIRKSEEKIASYNTEIQRMVHDRDKLDKLEEFLSKAMKDYTDKNDEKEHELIELNAEIDEKRKNIEGLSRMALKVKNEIGYDASDIGAILSSNKVNNDFASSKDELSALHAKFNSLVLHHKALCM
jgi:chromosome segregation ATPase